MKCKRFKKVREKHNVFEKSVCIGREGKKEEIKGKTVEREKMEKERRNCVDR